MTEEADVRKRPELVQLARATCRHAKLRCNRLYPACDQVPDCGSSLATLWRWITEADGPSCIKCSPRGSCAYIERGLRFNAARRNNDATEDRSSGSFVIELIDSETSFERNQDVHRDINDDSLSAAGDGLSRLTGKLRLSGSAELDGMEFQKLTHE
ncbi:hypothetical protein B0A50_03899 [Salinomyces thailandicus]|uniref:Uncharacterized protein n=1 Tax=Salinomyces thailandicus TaxID=706561 RepID=A0A4U0U1U2_9PEZI|nr:hypothetical protein B0A50_03899 [Salinomyces thailandica]